MVAGRQVSDESAAGRCASRYGLVRGASGEAWIETVREDESLKGVRVVVWSGGFQCESKRTERQGARKGLRASKRCL